MAQQESLATARSELYPTRLKPGYIRLLRVEPSLEGCFFESHALSDAPDFIAISYSWQSAYGVSSDVHDAHHHGYTVDRPDVDLEPMGRVHANASEQVAARFATINGKEYPVSQITADIIERAVYEDSVGNLWLDSLCINQADVGERNAQVSMMGEIYSTASNVACWLGRDEHGDAETVIEVCKLLQSESHRLCDEPGGNTHKIMNLFDPAVRSRSGLSSLTDDGWAAFGRFWNRSWFHRAWVIQEITLPSNLSFHWGYTQLDTAMLYDASAFLLDCETGLSASDDLDVRLSGPRNWFSDLDARLSGPRDWFSLGRRLGTTLAKTWALDRIVKHATDDGVLHDGFWRKCEDLGGPEIQTDRGSNWCERLWTHMLELFRAFDATDKRDHVYATWGLIKATAVNNGFRPPALVIDYRRTVAQVYADAVKCVMEAGDCVNILCLAQDPTTRNLKDLPSWVPDFSAGTEMPMLMGKPTRRRVMPMLRELSRSYDHGSKPFFKIESSLKSLRVKALLLDKVLATGETHHELANNGVWEQTGQILLARESFGEIPTESRIESLWRTMLANTGIETDDIASSSTKYDFKSFMIASLFRNIIHDPKHLEKSPSWWKLIAEEIEKHGLCDDMLTREEAHYWAAEADRRWKAIADGEPLPKETPIGTGATRFAWSSEAMFYRRIVLTESGYLGIAPASTRPGDEVWVMPNAPLPMVLRNVTSTSADRQGTARDRCILLGETYLHGNPDFHKRRQEWCWIELQ